MPAPLVAVADGVTSLIDGVKSLVFGSVMAIVGPALAPHMMLIAQTLQLSMGVMALAEVGVGFKEIHTLGAGIITLIITLIAVPDSFGWAIKEGTPVGDCYNKVTSCYNTSGPPTPRAQPRAPTQTQLTPQRPNANPAPQPKPSPPTPSATHACTLTFCCPRPTPPHAAPRAPRGHGALAAPARADGARLQRGQK